MDTSETQSGEPAPAVVSNDGSALWCWTEDLEAEIWHVGGASKGAAMLAAHRDGHSSFWVAPTRPAGEADVNDWMGDDNLETGDPMIDVDRIEEIPPNAKFSNAVGGLFGG